MDTNVDRGQKIMTDGGIDDEEIEQQIEEASVNMSDQNTVEEEDRSNRQKAMSVGDRIRDIFGRLENQNRELRKENARNLAESERQRGEKLGTRRGFLYGAGAVAGAGALGFGGLAAISQSRQDTEPLPQETNSATYGEGSDNSAEELVEITQYLENNFDENLPYSSDDLSRDYGLIENDTGTEATSSTIKYEPGEPPADSTFIHRLEYPGDSFSTQKPSISDDAARVYVGFDDYEGEVEEYLTELDNMLGKE